jgi:hypothetical protein
VLPLRSVSVTVHHLQLSHCPQLSPSGPTRTTNPSTSSTIQTSAVLRRATERDRSDTRCVFCGPKPCSTSPPASIYSIDEEWDNNEWPRSMRPGHGLNREVPKGLQEEQVLTDQSLSSANTNPWQHSRMLTPPNSGNITRRSESNLLQFNTDPRRDRTVPQYLGSFEQPSLSQTFFQVHFLAS